MPVLEGIIKKLLDQECQSTKSPSSTTSTVKPSSTDSTTTISSTVSTTAVSAELVLTPKILSRGRRSGSKNSKKPKKKRSQTPAPCKCTLDVKQIVTDAKTIIDELTNSLRQKTVQGTTELWQKVSEFLSSECVKKLMAGVKCATGNGDSITSSLSLDNKESFLHSSSQAPTSIESVTVKENN